MKWSNASSTRRGRGLGRGRAAIPLGIALVVGVPLVLAAGDSSVGAVTPDLPVFPDNLVVFPNRDFVTIEGFADHAGETGKVEVTRPGVGVVGSAQGVVSGGDVAFEVNHPGGYCWGAGTGLNVTPDILPGDVVSLSFGGTRVAATETLDIAADDAKQTGSTVVVTGHIGNGVLHDQMEQRIIEPALVDTAIGKRDVRALPGPPAPAPKGGYISGIDFGIGDQKFTATYVFDEESECDDRRPRRSRRAGDGLGVRRRGGQPAGADDRRERRAGWTRDGRVPERSAAVRSARAHERGRCADRPGAQSSGRQVHQGQLDAGRWRSRALPRSSVTG